MFAAYERFAHIWDGNGRTTGDSGNIENVFENAPYAHIILPNDA